jgi:hypothetical protein
VIRAGAVPAHYVPDASVGRLELDPAPASAELVEDAALHAHRVAPGFRPAAAAFLDGIEHWRVVAYDGVTPIVRAYVAAAVRGRADDRRLATMIRDGRDFVVARMSALTPTVRRELEQSGAEIVDVTGPIAAQPGGALEATRRSVERVRVELERGVAERYVNRLAPDEWLVVDGVLSESARLAEHPRALGIIKSHSAQYFDGADLECALRLPHGHRTSAFRPRGRGRHDVYSWYLRLWPWEGNDLLYGLLRVETCPHADAVSRASQIGGWLLAERAPISTPDARWDRLLYPIHDVETYLSAHAPAELRPASGSRLPVPA